MINKFVILDTETGGLTALLNPIISINLMVCRREPFAVLDTFHLKIEPPPGTLLQHSLPGDTSYNPPVTHLTDVNGKTYTCTDKGVPHDLNLVNNPVITSGAARVNGFTWETWADKGVDAAVADQTYVGHINTWFDRKPVVYAHNESFDAKYVRTYLPRLYTAVQSPWMCTMLLYRNYMTRHGEKHSAKLTEIAKRVNDDPSTPAYGMLKTATGSVIDRAHDAAADTIMCYAALIWLATKDGDLRVFPAEMPDEGSFDRT